MRHLVLRRGDPKRTAYGSGLLPEARGPQEGVRGGLAGARL